MPSKAFLQVPFAQCYVPSTRTIYFLVCAVKFFHWLFVALCWWVSLEQWLDHEESNFLLDPSLLHSSRQPLPFMLQVCNRVNRLSNILFMTFILHYCSNLNLSASIPISKSLLLHPYGALIQFLNFCFKGAGGDPTRTPPAAGPRRSPRTPKPRSM